jgi:hypothetical protein
VRKSPFIIIGVLIAAAVVLPWLAAYRGDHAERYSYGRIGGHQIECVAVDGTHFDRYFCLVFEDSAGSRVTCNHGHIFLDGQQLQFPAGQNAGFLRPNGQVQFVTVNERDIASDSPGISEVYYILGKVPKLKRFPVGVPRVEFVEQKLERMK